MPQGRDLVSKQPPPQGFRTSSSSLPEAAHSAARCLSGRLCDCAGDKNSPSAEKRLGVAVYPRGPALQTSAKGSWPFKLFILRISLGLPQGPAKGCGNWVIVYFTYQTLLERFLALALC